MRWPRLLEQIFGVANAGGRASSQPEAAAGTASAADKIVEPVIHIHEDAYGMRSLVPIAAYAEAHQDVEKAREEGERNASPTGMGWTDVYVAQAPSIDFSSVPLRLADAVRVFEKYFPRISRFTATASAGFDPNVKDPFGSYQTQAYCYGTGAACFVKLEHKDDIVIQIWFECWTNVREDAFQLRAALTELNESVPSAIIDYYLSAAGKISDVDFMNRYFEALEPPASA